MKRIFCCAMIAFMLMVSINVFATNPTVSVTCPESVNSEDIFKIYVTISKNSNVAGGSVRVVYDNNVLEILSIKADTLLGNALFQSNIAYTDTSAKVSWSNVENIIEEGNLIEVSFRAKPTYKDVNTTISLESIKLTDSETNLISATYGNEAQVMIKFKDLPILSVESNDEIIVGTTFDVYVNLAGTEQICGGRFDLVYDDSKLKIESVQMGSVLKGTNAYINKDYANNTIRISWASTSPLSECGNLLNVRFKSLENVCGEAIFNLANCKLVDKNDISIQGSDLDVINANSINIVNVPTNPTIFVSNVAKSDKVTCDVRLVSPNALSGVVLVGLYGDDRLLDFKIFEAQKDIPVTINSATGTKLKVMWWEGLGNMRPLAEAVEKDID